MGGAKARVSRESRVAIGSSMAWEVHGEEGREVRAAASSFGADDRGPGGPT